MQNKVILITGSTDGIGKQTAIDLVKKGAKVIIHGRDKKRLEDTANQIFKESGNEVFDKILADYSSLEDVNKMANYILENHEKLDVLFNNVALFSNERKITNDGFEENFQVNYLSHFLLTQKLIPLMKKSEHARIVNISSMIHASSIDFDNLQFEKSYTGSGAYASTKLYNILHSNKLAEILENTSITANSLHPGVINTKLLNAAWSGGFPLSEGSRVLQYAAESEVLDNISGMYLENNRPMQSNPVSYDKEVQQKLWDVSMKFLEKYLS